MPITSLLDHLSGLEDPRQSWKVVYPLPEIMPLVLYGTLSMGENFVEILRWGREKLSFLRTMLPFARGIPSHDTRNGVLNALDPALFSDGFTAWVDGLREPTSPDRGPPLPSIQAVFQRIPRHRVLGNIAGGAKPSRV